MSISPSFADMQQHGFPVGAEPSVALDLVDTVANAHTESTDLLAGNRETWWALESGRLPDAELPTDAATTRLRWALREVFEAAIDDRLTAGKSVDELNRVAASAYAVSQLEVAGGIGAATRWHAARDGNPRLAAIARDAIELVADPIRRAQLRRCANPTCSMLFLAENPRRVWCASNICGNRARVARHQQRHNAQSND
ncbi:MAG TPA: CGNR zinc finger domain-containing protein [Galbitalea sp.]|jgi:predicted RNA-binding Zn ribbon-like protein